MFLQWWMARSFKKSSTNQKGNNQSQKWIRPGVQHLLVTMILLSLLLSGCSFFPSEEIEEIVPVVAPMATTQKPEYTVKRETIEQYVRGNGRLLAKKEESLYFEETVYPIAEILVESGQQVKKGDVLVRLDTKDLSYKIKESELEMKLAELEMIQKLREEDANENSLELERAKMMFEKQKLQHQQLLETSVKSVLVAPFSGEVIAVKKKVGDQIEAYKPVIVLADLSDLAIQVTFSQSDLKTLAVGMPAVVKISGVERELEGKVASLPQENTDTNVPQEQYVTIAIEGMPEGLSRGTMVDAKVVTMRKENVLTIQGGALRTYNGRTYVQVKDENGRRDVDIEVGIQTPTQIEVVSGLEEGQIVIGR